ncbi:hypothetical protein [Glycomyces harbinensis]|uniref:Uncharacterized protein n=1 Tax=Glycomyces harbinensis TaxID=58114 RepID=A0A1G7C9V3_9ACTN|nr:hypothetical protein [Glycomyces harbinensis]SDE35520.1 hypothetical protein SAMN05216270_11914 [Glycomyces harbinensis]
MTISGSEALLDGLAIGHLPDRLGAASDFEFEWGEVQFVQRVWETEVDPGVWRVDLQVQVLRGAGLTDLDALRDFLVEYHERGDDWKAEPFGADGLASGREVARLLAPSLAVEVRDPFERQGIDAVKTVAAAVRPA